MNKELQTIAAVLHDGDITSFLNVSHDLFEMYGDVREFIIKYYVENKDMPPLGVVRNKFSIEFPTDVGSTKHHLDELKDLYVKRRLRSILKETSQKIQDDELASAINGLMDGSLLLKQHTINMNDLDATDIEATIEHIDRVNEMNARGVYGIKFGIPGIDDFLPSGMIPGMFGLILGYPARGKSMFSTLLAVNAWDYGKKVLYVSLEMTEIEVRSRIHAIAGRGRWSLRDLQRGDVDKDEFRIWAKERFDGRPDFPIISQEGYERFTPASLRAKIEEYSPDIVFVDYIQLMSPNSASDGNETIRLKNISTELKLLAKSSGTPILAVVSATPNDATNMNTIPELGQVAWSKQLAYDCDFLWAVGRADNSPVMGIAWRKNRNGANYDFAIDCDFDNGVYKYMELDFDDDAPVVISQI